METGSPGKDNSTGLEWCLRERKGLSGCFYTVFCLGPVHTGKNDPFSFDAFQKYLHKDGFTAKPLRAVGTL